MSFEGIPYFPHECIASTPIRLVQSKFGICGYGVVYKLYEKIFSSGYYAQWNDEICEIFAYEDCRLKAELVKSIVELCLEKGVFDREIYLRYGVLTSAEIQRKFYNAAKHRKNFKFDGKLWLIAEGSDDEEVQGSRVEKPGADSVVKGKNSKSEGLFEQYKKAAEEDCGIEFVNANAALKPWLEQFEPLVILFAFSLCIRKGKENADYLFGIFRNWKKSGVMYIEDIDDPLLATPDFMNSHPELQAERIKDFMKA